MLFFMNTTIYHGNSLQNMHFLQENHDQVKMKGTVETNLNPTSDLSEKWALKLLRECAKAISDNDSGKIHHLLWTLNEIGSSYGDHEQKLASLFLQALFCKVTKSGARYLQTMIPMYTKSFSFDLARKVILKFQEVSPWTTFGHVASNGVLLEELDGEAKLHIIDISNTICTQWPILLESLATRNDETPHLKLTVVVTGSTMKPVMEEVGLRMEKFARLMGVPFEFYVISSESSLSELTKENLRIKDDEAIAVNCIGTLRKVPVSDRSAMLERIKSLGPKVVTIVEEEADFTVKGDFCKCFEEYLRFYNLYFDMLNESFLVTSNERLILERECNKDITCIVACDEDCGVEIDKREKGEKWSERFKEFFEINGFSGDVIDDVKALLKRYRSGWSLVQAQGRSFGLYLSWKDVPVVWASAWKPNKQCI